MEKDGTEVGHGSGVVLQDGTILTANHVAEKLGNDFFIVFADGTRASGKVIKLMPKWDLALIATSVSSGIPRATLNCNQLHSGDSVTVIGYPGPLPLSVTYGRIMSPEIFIAKGFPEIVINALIIPGNSGGPVFDANGDLIGIANLGAESHDLGMMVPVRGTICNA